MSRRGDQALVVDVAWAAGVAASLAFECGAAAVALDVHLEDGGMMNQAIEPSSRNSSVVSFCRPT